MYNMALEFTDSPGCGTSLQSRQLIRRSVTLTQHFLIQHLQGAVNERDALSHHLTLRTRTTRDTHLCSSTRAAWSPFRVSASDSRFCGTHGNTGW